MIEPSKKNRPNGKKALLSGLRKKKTPSKPKWQMKKGVAGKLRTEIPGAETATKGKGTYCPGPARTRERGEIQQRKRNPREKRRSEKP